MPIITPKQLSELQEQIRFAIADANLEEALDLLREALPAGRPKANQVTLLNGRANDILDYDINNTLPSAQLDILRNELRLDLLTFVDHLSLHDFSAVAMGRPELQPGHLLYQVPSRMAVRETKKCLVRIAHQLSQVLDGIHIDASVTMEEIPVSEVMEVEIIDPSPAGERAFDILLLSDGEQIVDEYMATEWVFNVRPLREGVHELVLKISVLITVGDKERTKNIVMSRPITVAAELMEEDAEPALIRVIEGPRAIVEEMAAPSPPPPPLSSPPPPLAAPSPPASSLPIPPKERAGGGVTIPLPAPSLPEEKSSRKRYSGWMNIAAAALMLLVATFLLLPSGNESPATIDTDKTNIDVPPPDKTAPYLRQLRRDTITAANGRRMVISLGITEKGDTITVRDTLR